MPVTARLLQRLHETLGDDATNDLLAWWEESVVSRAELKEVIESLAQRFGTEMAVVNGELRAEMAAIKGELRGEMAAMKGELRAEMAAMKGELRAEIANQRADLLKWMFIFWAGTVIPLAGLMLALTRA